MEHIKKVLTYNNIPEIGIGLLYQKDISIFPFQPEKGNIVFAFAIFRKLCGMLIIVPYLPEQIQRYIGQGNIGFQAWPVTAKFAEALPEDEGVISEGKYIIPANTGIFFF